MSVSRLISLEDCSGCLPVKPDQNVRTSRTSSTVAELKYTVDLNQGVSTRGGENQGILNY